MKEKKYVVGVDLGTTSTKTVIFDFEGKEYIALFPQDGTDDIYIYGYKELDDEEVELIDIEDDSEFEKVAAEFELLSLEEE